MSLSVLNLFLFIIPLRGWLPTDGVRRKCLCRDGSLPCSSHTFSPQRICTVAKMDEVKMVR